MEMARYIFASETLKQTAALHPAGASDQVPRSTLMDEVSERLPSNTTAMISEMLNLVTATTKGDKTHMKRIIRRGGPQASPLSPSFFKLFMDTYKEHPEATLEKNQELGE